MHLSRTILRAALVYTIGISAGQAAPSPLHVEALTGNVDLDRHTVMVQLRNGSDKILVAYMLDVQAFGADGSRLSDQHIGIDHIYFNPTDDPENLGRLYVAAPGKEVSEHLAVPVESATARVRVLTAIYADRTIEGDKSAAGPIFSLRQSTADKLRKAATRMSVYPAGREAATTAIENLRAIDDGHVQATLSETFGIPMDVLLHKDRPLPNPITISPEQWQQAAERISAEAEFWQEGARQ